MVVCGVNLTSSIMMSSIWSIVWYGFIRFSTRDVNAARSAVVFGAHPFMLGCLMAVRVLCGIVAVSCCVIVVVVCTMMWSDFDK